jgi:hypothetical protein
MSIILRSFDQRNLIEIIERNTKILETATKTRPNSHMKETVAITTEVAKKSFI